MAQTDYKSVLSDFMADIEEKNFTDDEIFQAYPEFNNDKKMLDAAYQYYNTVKANKYDEPTLQSKFPEFFGQQEQSRVKNPAPTTEEEYQRNLQKQDSIQGVTNDPNNPWVAEKQPEQKKNSFWSSLFSHNPNPIGATTDIQGRSSAQQAEAARQEQERQQAEWNERIAPYKAQFDAQWQKDEPILDDVWNKANEKASAAAGSVMSSKPDVTNLPSTMGGGFGNIGYSLLANRAANQQNSPEAIINEFGKELDKKYGSGQAASDVQLQQQMGASNDQYQLYKQYVEDKIMQRFAGMNVPQSKLDYFARKFIQGNLIAQAASLYTDSPKTRQAKNAGIAQYEQENTDAGTKAVAFGADVANVVADPLMWLMPGAGEVASRSVVGGLARRQLAKLGVSDAAGVAERLMAQRGSLRTAQRLISSATMMTGIDVGHDITNQLYETGNVEFGKVLASAGRGAATGLLFGGVGRLGDAVQSKVTNLWNSTAGAVAGKSAHFLGGTNVMVGTSVLAQVMQGVPVSDIDWWQEYTHAAAMQLFFDVQGGLKVAKNAGGLRQAWEAIKRDPNAGSFTRDEIEQFNKAGIDGNDAYTILRNLNGGKDFTSLEEYERVMDNISANDNIDTQAKYKLASLLYGEVHANVQPIYVAGITQDENGRYVVRTFDNGGRSYETRTFGNEREALRFQQEQHEATRNNLKDWQEQVVRTQEFAEKVGEVTDEAVAKTIENYPQLSREDAYRILTADPDELSAIEKAIRKQMDSYLTADVKGVDVIEDIQKQLSRLYGKDVKEVLGRDYRDLNEQDKQIFDAYIDELGKRMPVNRQAAEERAAIEQGGGVPTEEAQPTEPISPVAAERERIEAETTQYITERTNQDGNVYHVTLAGDDSKSGYVVGENAPAIEQDGDKLIIRNNDVVTVKWDDGTVSQVPAKDLDLIGEPNTPDAFVSAEVDRRMNEFTANRMQNGENPIMLQDAQGNVQGFFPTEDADVVEDEYGNKVALDELKNQGWVALDMDANGQTRQMSIDEIKRLMDNWINGGGNPPAPPMGGAPVYQVKPEEERPNVEVLETAAPDITKMTAEEFGTGMVEFMGGKADAVAYLEAERDKADAEVKRTAKLQVGSYKDMYDFRDKQAAIREQRSAAIERYNKLQNAIAAANNYKTPEEQEAESARQAAAEARRAARRQTEIAAASNGTPAEKWKVAEKTDGNAVTRTLPDGTVIKGHYILTEAGAATPSNDPFDNWNTSNGFPTTEDGRNINDRDYKNDKDAQQITMQIAQTYDGQAVEQVPVVSNEGIVYDGNGRTIAGNIAAANNTDAAYIDALKANAQNFGFTPEQVASMQHPRVYLQTDENLPYNTTTFAKFNAQEKKSQSSTNRAISHSKKLTEAARDNMLEIIDNYGNLDTFFNSEKGASDIMRTLLDTGVISQQEVAGLTEATDRGYILSPSGRDAITDMLLGAVFSEDTIRMLGNDKGLKQSILRAMPSIVENRRLGDYALTGNIGDAIQLLYEARQQKLTYQQYLLQGNAFDGFVKDRYSAFDMLLAEEMSSGVDAFRNVLDIYNNSARNEANGQMSIVDPRTANDIKNEILNHYGKENEQAAAEPAAAVEPAGTQTEPAVPSAQPSVEQQPVVEQEQEQAEAPARPESQEIQGMKRNVADVEETVRNTVRDILDENGYNDVDIVGVKAIGSRVNGNAREDSDLDVLVEYKGDAREDALFNLLHEGDGISIDGVKVDVNPITEGKSGTIEQFMRRSDEYLAEQKAGQEPEQPVTEEQKLDVAKIDALEEAFSLYDTYADHDVYKLLKRVNEIADGNKEVAGIVDSIEKALEGEGLADIDARDEAADELRRQLQDIILRERGENSAILAENAEKNEKNDKNILSNEKKVVSLQQNQKEYTADGLSVVVSKDDYTTYTTPEAKEVFAKLGQKQGHARPELSYISFASRDGVIFTLDVLKSDPSIQEAQARIDAKGGKPLELTQEQVEEYANRLLSAKKDVKQERKAFLIIGRPAAGKSSVFADPIAEKNGARIIDSDDVKPWLDGYDNGYGAGHVQIASAAVANEALSIATINGDNVVIPKIGGASVIDEIVLPLKELGYSVELYYNEVVPESSYTRAMARFAEKGRFLSLKYLEDIGDKATKTFNNFSTKTIGETIDELPSQKVQDLRGRLERLHEVEERILSTRLGREGRSVSESELSGLLESRESGRGRDIQLANEPLFDRYEWKNNDVPWGQEPKLIKEGTNEKPQRTESAQVEEQPKATFEKGQELLYKGKNKVVVEGVQDDGTYIVSYPNALGISTTMIGIPEKDLSPIEQPKQEKPNSKPMFTMDKWQLGENLVNELEVGQRVGDDVIEHLRNNASHGYNEEDGLFQVNWIHGSVLQFVKDADGMWVYDGMHGGRQELYNTDKYGNRTTEQESADSIAIKDEAEAIVAEAAAIERPERAVEPAERDGGREIFEGISGERGNVELTEDERDEYVTKAQGAIDKIDSALDKVNDQLALLGYYDEELIPKEGYAHVRTALFHVLKDADKLGKQLADDLGIEINKRKKIASANIAPAGGDITMRLPLADGKELYMSIEVRPNTSYYYAQTMPEDILVTPSLYWRVEDPTASGMSRYLTGNRNYGGYSSNRAVDVTYNELLQDVKRIAGDYLPKVDAGVTRAEIAKKAVEKATRKKADKNRISDGQQVLDLFSDAIEEANTAIQEENKPVEKIVKQPKRTDNGSKELRNDGKREVSTPQTESTRQPADENGTLGGSEPQTDERPDGRGVDKSGEQHRVDDGERSSRTAIPSATTDVKDLPESEWKNTNNFRARSGEALAPTTPKARYEANMAAIRLLKQLQVEGRQATREEQEILSQYSGWGGLGEYFRGEPGTTYWSRAGEKSPYQEIASVLNEDELQAAQMSRNSAYYTPAPVIETLWDVAKQLGFRGGNILEGSAGIGNILALMPSDISHRSDIQAVEIDDITAGILAQLYPDAKTYHSGFEKVNIPNNSIDLAITNVPFVTGLRVFDPQEKDLSKRFGNIHDFCIAKNIRKLRQGGVGIFITASGTLDSSKDLRRWITKDGNADVIGAFRMNNETFGGTTATSDIIVVRKRVNGEKDPRAIDVLDTKVARVANQELEEEWNRKTGKYEKPEPIEHKLAYNQYFVEHPESMGGVMGYGFEHGDTRYGGTTAGCYVDPSVDQAENLRKWVDGIEKGEVKTVKEAPKASGDYEKYNGNAPYGALELNSKGEICRVSHGELVPVDGINPQKVKGHSKSEVLKDYNTLKNAVESALNAQSKDISDDELKPYLKDLNAAYDGFVRKYGSLNGNTSLSFLRNDVQWASIAALENVKETLDANGKKKIDISKTDVFSKRVVGVQPEPKAENAKDGVILSVQQFGNIRPEKIAEWLGKPAEDVEKEIIESRLGFRDPQTGNIQVRHEYLSGNVREKLEYAQEHNQNGQYDTNIEELRKVLPIDIPAHLIEFNIGSTWIPTELYKDYLKEKFDVENLKLSHVGSSWVSDEDGGRYGKWSLHNEKNRQEGVYSELLGKQVYGHELMLAAMNNVPIVVSETKKNWDGTTTTTTDKQATATCSDKIGQIKDDFVEWARGKMQQDEELAARVQDIYNDRFNSIVPMLGVDKMFLSPHLPNQNHKYTLYDHQQQAVVRATTQPVMLAHEVGTGKTITLISSAMEMRRLGTAKKPMIVVQNATVGQFVSEAKDLYPNAKILTVSERDRTKEGRQEFYAKIKYNDWDLIIVPQSVFDMIPDSEARMRDFIEEKIEEKIHAIEAAKEANVDSRVTKRMERELDMLREDLDTNNMSGKRTAKKKEKDAKKEAAQRESAKARAEEMLDRRTDDVSDFDDMGIDALLIDEAHNYKHLGFSTMMTRGVKGVDPSYSKRAAALYLKCQSVYERNGHRNVVFATGTPISNTAAEIWTFMKYLMPKEVLKENDIYYFDDFVHNFGKINEQLEFATNGKFKANNRFAQYGNVPELMRMWLTCADCVLTREVGQVNDKVPEIEGGKAQDIFLPQSPSLIDIMAAVRAKLEEYDKMSGAEKKENSHIPLTMYGIAKRAAIDPRLVSANAVDEPLSKTNKAVEETLNSLESSKKYNGTVAIFCDSYQNKQTGFNLFNDIKDKLVKNGVPASKIAIIRSEMTDNAKQKIFDAVREGEIRVIMGSTQTLGTGVNIQTRLHTLIHMDAPDRPMDYTQRNGRILRQGNMHKQLGIPVRVLRFGVEDSLDVTSYQRLKTKAGFIDSIMNGKSLIDNNLENRVIEDVEEGIFDNPVAMLSGSQFAMLKSQAERDLRKWKARKEQHKIDQILIANRLKSNVINTKREQQNISAYERRLQVLNETIPNGKVTEYNVDGQVARTPEQLREAIKAATKTIQDQADAVRHSSRWDEERTVITPVSFNGLQFEVVTKMKRKSTWKDGGNVISAEKTVTYGCDALGMKDIPSQNVGLDNVLDYIESNILTGATTRENIQNAKDHIERMAQEDKLMHQREGKQFEHQAELDKAQALVDEYTEKMKAEMAEKEAKYAQQSTKAVDLDNMDAEDEVEPDIDANYPSEVDNYIYIAPREDGETRGDYVTRRMTDKINDFRKQYQEQLENTRDVEKRGNIMRYYLGELGADKYSYDVAFTDKEIKEFFTGVCGWQEESAEKVLAAIKAKGTRALTANGRKNTKHMLFLGYNIGDLEDLRSDYVHERQHVIDAFRSTIISNVVDNSSPEELAHYLWLIKGHDKYGMEAAEMRPAEGFKTLADEFVSNAIEYCYNTPVGEDYIDNLRLIGITNEQLLNIIKNEFLRQNRYDPSGLYLRSGRYASERSDTYDGNGVQGIAETDRGESTNAVGGLGGKNRQSAQRLISDERLEELRKETNQYIALQDYLLDDTDFSLRSEPAPKQTGIGYKVFFKGKDGKLYPPMVANPNGEDTPIGVWLDADAAPIVGESKTGRPKVKAGGKGTQGGSGTLAYRPGWHLGEIPFALQFNRKDENGNKTLFPKDFVWAEVEYAADKDYQHDAYMQGWIGADGKLQKGYNHAYAGLPYVPQDGYYRYRTNPDPKTDPWIITGAMKVNRVLSNEEVDDLVRAAGRKPQRREGENNEREEIISSAKSDKSFMRAPNGKKTLLNETKWVDVRTKNFKRWFGDWQNDPENASKVLDKNGEPLVVYHGTPYEFDEFSRTRNSDGYYFFDKENLASQYENTRMMLGVSPRKNDTARTLSMFLNIRKPFELVVNGKYDRIDRKRVEAMLNGTPYEYKYTPNFHYSRDFITPSDVVKMVKEKGGYDGVIFRGIADNIWSDDYRRGDVYVTFDSNQIKSSNNNNGRYSESPNFNASYGGNEYLTRSEMITRSLVQNAKDNYDIMQQALRRVNADIQALQSAARMQVDLDRNTVISLLNLYNTLMRSGGVWSQYMPNTTAQIATQIRNAIGREDITPQVNKIMDYVVDAQKQVAKAQWEKLRGTKIDKLNISGVATQGKVAVQGQHALKALNDALYNHMTSAQLDEQIAEMDYQAHNATDESLRSQYEGKRIGYMIASDYNERVESLLQERQQLRDQLAAARGDMSLKSSARKELVESLQRALRDNNLDQAEAYRQVADHLQGYIEEQRVAAKDFVAKQDANREKIRDYAARDLSGLATNPNRLRTKQNIVRDMWDAIASPIRDMQSLLRLCGLHAPDGEGYLYNHFMRGWTDAADTERTGVVSAQKTLDDKVSELTHGKYKTWEEAAIKIQNASRNMFSLTMFNGEDADGKPIEEEIPLNANNALYIYAVNKMEDGKMKLRAMNISESDVEKLAQKVRDEFGQELLDVADWIQSSFFSQLRNRYNPTHEALFGAPMDAIENYFPLVINPNSRQKNEDLGDADTDASRLLTGTSTGAIKRRTKNQLPLDVRNADFFQQVIRHISQMERWNAFAQWTRDANILFSDINFRNRVKGMKTIYGTGDALYNYMKDAFKVASGTYRADGGKADALSRFTLNAAKGVTSAKINFRLFTAVKQLASFPAFFTYMQDGVFVGSYLRNWATPHSTMKWAKENLPNFEKRISKRDLGDMRLMQRSTDWQWNKRVLEWSQKYGMFANIYFDTLTCATGARAVYDSRFAEYLNKGFAPEQAQQRAKQDAEQAFNTSQQSSEGAYMAPVQQDRNIITAALTVFRTSPIQYTRNFVYHTRDLLNKFGKKDEQIAFRAEQYRREGLNDEQAQQAAEKDFNKSIRADITGVVVYGALLNILWRLAGQVPYLIFGQEGDKKKEIFKDAVSGGAMVSPITGLLGGGIVENAIDGHGSVADMFAPELPMTQDMKRAAQYIKNDKYAEFASQALSVLMQSGTGFDPQTAGDIIARTVTTLDSEQDLSAAEQATRITQALFSIPQSQYEQILVDEVIDSKREYKDALKDYERYMAVHTAPLTWYLRDDESRRKSFNTAKTKFDKLIRERRELRK